jgi:DNA-directed RNA polymerase specialized sigma24 family protein
MDPDIRRRYPKSRLAPRAATAEERDMRRAEMLRRDALGHTYADIGAAMGVSPQAVSQVIRRARRETAGATSRSW